MKKKLSRLTLENFRIFEGPVSFKFSDITVFTGANNTGKSTVIKAIKLFMEGIEMSDFPKINLLTNESDLGRFNDIVNKKCGKKYFSIGFPTRINAIPDPFTLVYTFVEGNEARDHFKDTALFADLEIKDPAGNVFFGIYSEDVMGYDMKKIASIDFPSESGEPGLLQFRLNIVLLEKYLSKLTNRKFSALVKHLKTIMGKDNCWWGECFHEGDYSLVNYDISKFSFADFETELYDDAYFNLARYVVKKNLFFGDEREWGDNYINLKKRLKYIEFIQYVIKPILDSIKSGLALFRNTNIIHIIPENTQDRLIRTQNQTDYIQRLYRVIDEPENIKFIRESLAKFNIDGLIEIIPHLTSAFELNLITNIGITLQKKREEIARSNEAGIAPDDDSLLAKFLVNPSSYEGNFDLYKTNPRINIADLGKGVSNIIKLILKIASVLIAASDDDNQQIALPSRKGQRPKSGVRKTILFEEPEAFLHPNWQSKLADFFLYCMENRDIQFIIETHSEYLIRKLQYSVAKKLIKSENVSIYYFSERQNEADKDQPVTTIHITDDGGLDKDFGPGFFDEAINLKLDILKLKNSQNN